MIPVSLTIYLTAELTTILTVILTCSSHSFKAC
jgi:hypothetical protein